MKAAAESTCDQHEDRWDCPDALISYSEKFDEYGIIVHDGGIAVCGIEYCPWCGTRLPESKRDRWFAELDRIGISDPWEDEIPEAYQDRRWYSDGKEEPNKSA